jgi:hypothetical protein
MSSKRNIKKKACINKIKHVSMEEAQKHANRLRFKLGQRWVIPYKCECCGSYHVGHAPKNIRQSIRDKSLNKVEI